MKKSRVLIMMILLVGSIGTNVSAKESDTKKKSKRSEVPIRLESNFIGDKEQPSVSYFIPWNEVGTPDKLQWNIGSKRDKTLSVVDRNIMLRTTNVYNELQLEQSTAPSGKAN